MENSHICGNVLVVTGSSLFFFGLSRVLAQNNCISSKVRKEKIDLWYNVLTSLVHSSISSFLCFVCFLNEPAFLFTMDSLNTTHASRFTTNISLGYFLFDFVDTIKRFSFAFQWPVLAHHVIIVLEFTSIGWYLGLYNYVIAALLSEINSVFLHTRQLLHYSKFDQTKLVYKANKHLNLVTFLTVRMTVIPWVFVRGNVYGEFPPGYILTYGNYGVFLMVLINLVLLSRIINNDYLGRIEKQKSA